jgi:hypothetical protein
MHSPAIIALGYQDRCTASFPADRTLFFRPRYTRLPSYKSRVAPFPPNREAFSIARLLPREAFSIVEDRTCQ